MLSLHNYVKSKICYILFIFQIELNGRMIERLEHRLAFHKVLKC